MRTRAEIIDHLGAVQDLPTLPTVITKILETSRNPNAQAKDMGNLISQDQSLTTKTLKLVNSAFYGFPKQITSITRAIVILGFEKVKSIALTASVFGAVKIESGKGGFDIAEFWRHSLAVGIMAETLADRVGSAHKNDAFIAGLLHDLGKVVTIKFFKDEMLEIVQTMSEDGGLWYDVEAKHLEGGHPFIGSWLAEEWNFPKKLISPIKYHHKPERDREHRELSFLVHAADVFVRALDIGNPGDDEIPQLSENVWDAFKMNEQFLEDLFEVVLNKARMLDEFMELAS